MPSLGMLTINALACADSVLNPVQAAYLPVKGLEQLIKTIGRVQRRLNKDLRIEGILLTMVDARTNYAIACCNDGTRPVIFKIERIDIPETPEEEWLSKQDFHNGADQAYTG